MGRADRYRDLGLKVGLEIHQRLLTHKLFCNCPSAMREDEPPLWFRRNLRVSRSELGSIDPAARFEQLRSRDFVYGVYPDTTCEVELDEAPPLPLNEEALEIAIQIALLLRMEVVDEVQVMRKIVIDGSNTAGFQRTALVAVGGDDSFIDTSGGPVGLTVLCLEEESAFIVESQPSLAKYRLDRLGIPLVEVATGPDIRNPGQAREAALKLGRILRATGKVLRGIGTIRQDLNVSISKGARQEIKGVQELDLIPEIVEREVRRQKSLLEVTDETRDRGIEEGVFSYDFPEVTEVLRESESELIKRALSSGSGIFSAVLPGMAGLLGREIQPGRRLGTELSDYARVFGGIGGLLHSDELPGYGVTRGEVHSLMKSLDCGERDAFVLVLGARDSAEIALRAVVDRAKYALTGVPGETRRPLPNGNTSFSRPLPGAARMYPETDILPVKTRPIVEVVAKRLPALPEETIERFVSESGLTRDLAELLFDQDKAGVFEELVDSHPGVPRSFVAATLTSTLTALRRDGVEVDALPEEVFFQIFDLVERGRLAKEAIPEVLTKVLEGPTTVEEIAAQLTMSLEELDEVIRAKIHEIEGEVGRRGRGAFGLLMGLVMQEARGRVDGSVVSRRVREELDEYLEEHQK